MNGAAEEDCVCGGENVAAVAGPSEGVGHADALPTPKNDVSACTDADANGTSGEAERAANGEEAAADASEVITGAVADDVADDTPAAPQDAPPPAPPQDATPTRSGFFSRLGRPAAAASAPSTWGDVYNQAQKRASQLREQAAMEVERLRAQREQQAREAQKQQPEEFVIPPSTGTLVDGNAVAPDEQPAENESAGEAEGEANTETEAQAAERAEPKAAEKDAAEPEPKKSPLRDAIKLIHKTSAEAAQQLIFPVDALAGSSGESSSYSQDSDDSPVESRDSVDTEGSAASVEGDGDGEEAMKSGEKDGIFKKSGSNGSSAASAAAAAASTLTPTRFGALSGIGQRFRNLRETGSFDSSHHGGGSPRQTPGATPAATPVVGGADRVGGLRHFQLEGVVDASPLPPPLPPSMPLGGKLNDLPPGREEIAKQTGGEWTMASKRGPNAVATSAPPPLPPVMPPRTFSASSDVASVATSEASEEGQIGTARAAPTKRTSYYEEAVRSVLQPGQRALFFGKGTMGVVLKPTYLASWRGRDGGGLLSSSVMAKGGKRGGVFIDSMIPGGHADKSGVVFVGDHVVKIGSVNVDNMTLEEVVAVIQATKRPNIMVLTSEHEIRSIDVAENRADETKDRRFDSPLDLAFGFANKLLAEGIGDLASPESSPGKALKPAVSTNSLLDNDGDEDEESTKDEEVLFGSPAAKASIDPSPDTGDGGERGKPTVEPEGTPVQSEPAVLPSYTVEDLFEYASHRTNSPGRDGETQHQRAATLKRAALFSPDFRSALRLSLSECISDPRRYSFVEHFFRNHQSRKEMEAGNQEGEDENDVTSSLGRLLALYLELCKFKDVLSACSASDREHLLEYARTVSQLFLPEEGSPDQRNSGCLPEFVAHTALGGTEKVQSVRFALRDEDEFFSGGSNGFDGIRSSLEAFLSTQESYLSFLISDDCARMRAYLHGTCPYLTFEPQAFLKSDADGFQHNILLHAILHLICRKEEREEGRKGKDDNYIKNDALAVNFGKRNTGASSLIGCAIFITRSLKQSMEAAVEGLIEDGMAGGGTSANLQIYQTLVDDLEFLWEVFVAPAGGALSSLALSDDVLGVLDATRRVLVSSVDKVTAKEEKTSDERAVVMARMLSSVEVSSSVQGLADALLREYALKVYPDFCRHIFYEWACKEGQERLGCPTATDEYLATYEFNGLAKGWMNRFLRQMEFPPGISLHRPSPNALLPSETADTATSSSRPASDSSPNGDVALVFGADGVSDGEDMRRFSCVSLHPETDAPCRTLMPDDVPPIFESYALVPPFNERPFQGMLQDAKNGRISADGWEISLTNFVIPSQGNGGSDEDKWMYCVSLVLHKSSTARPQVSEREINNECVSELQCDNSDSETSGTYFASPLSVTKSEYAQSRTMRVSQELKEFNKQLVGPKWSQQNVGATIGLALISSRNVTVAMRETLSLLFNDFCSVTSPLGDKPLRQICQPLVDLLGVLSHSEVEAASLGCLLQPYVAHTTSRWIHRPLSDQSSMFLDAAGMQLLQALPPVPLALAFVTLLLEQKVVFSSSRRGVLMSTSFAMMQLLKPLKWAHLHVPLVPFSMMNELIHYPAPFMLGIPTDEKESAAILSTLPSDVTLVDLDVGRVILSSVFASNDSKSTDGEDGEAVTAALRSQVLFLAESLGGAFGAAMHPNSWCSDSPFAPFDEESTPAASSFSGVLSICEDFVSELVSGIHSCCLWIEEDHSSEARSRSDPAIIFDEDRFFHIKNLRAEGRYTPLIKKPDAMGTKRPLSLDHFDLIFETFLRTQSLSAYISDGNKKSMSFW